MVNDFYKFYQSNKFFLTEQEHILDMAFCACTDLLTAPNIVQKFSILCNVNNFYIVHNQDANIGLNNKA